MEGICFLALCALTLLALELSELMPHISMTFSRMLPSFAFPIYGPVFFFFQGLQMQTAMDELAFWGSEHDTLWLLSPC